MPTTPLRALPYPAPAAVPDVPFDLKALAERVETFLGVLPSKFKFAGPVSVTTNASGEYVLSHNLGVVPSLIWVTQDAGTASSPIFITAKISTATATQVTLVANNLAANAPFVGSMSIRWAVAA